MHNSILCLYDVGSCAWDKLLIQHVLIAVVHLSSDCESRTFVNFFKWKRHLLFARSCVTFFLIPIKLIERLPTFSMHFLQNFIILGCY